jgi:hypothetical protein
MRALLYVFLSLLVTTQAKVSTVTVQLNRENPWRYLTKFAVSIGKGKWKVRAKFVKPVDASSPDEQKVTVSVYLDENWEESMFQDSCDKKKDSSKRDKGVRVPLNGEWSSYVDGTLSQKIRPHVWYFTASDCEGYLADVKPRLRFEFTFIQSDGSHFSTEEQG